MARNEEKAQLMMNRWVTMKREFAAGHHAERRPYLASECETLGEAEKWRLQIVREVSRKVSEIQNAGLGEHKLRDLNDQINKLLREKGHWQRRIRELGGPDYNALEPAALDADGRALPGGGGYRYFGAARALPGVKELFEASAPTKKRRTRGDMFKRVTPDYYGFRDDEFQPDLAAKEALKAQELQAIARQEEAALVTKGRNKRARTAFGGAAGISSSGTKERGPGSGAGETNTGEGDDAKAEDVEDVEDVEDDSSDDDPDQESNLLDQVRRLHTAALAQRAQQTATTTAESQALLAARKRDLLDAILPEDDEDDVQDLLGGDAAASASSTATPAPPPAEPATSGQ